MRDIRIAAIYEGTTGMQAQDFLMRRLWRDEGRGLSVFLRQARHEASTLREQFPEISSTAEQVWREFEELSDRVLDYRSTPRQGEAVADAYLRAGWIAASCWMALRLLETAHGAILSEFVLLTAQENFRVQAKKCLLLAELLGSRYSEEDA